jgi:hypothetical protein
MLRVLIKWRFQNSPIKSKKCVVNNKKIKLATNLSCLVGRKLYTFTILILNFFPVDTVSL